MLRSLLVGGIEALAESIYRLNVMSVKTIWVMPRS
ncbi:MAG: hypothetical protein ACI80K_003879 [Paracoccaceae bacterium]|jgi:hypothetical protein